MGEIRRNSDGHGVPRLYIPTRPNLTSRDCRNATATNGYPVFRDGSVNCLTHVRKFFEYASSLVGTRQSIRRAASDLRFTWPYTAGKYGADLDHFPVLYRCSAGLPTKMHGSRSEMKRGIPASSPGRLPLALSPHPDLIMQRVRISRMCQSCI
jgi:hypothetical protein